MKGSGKMKSCEDKKRLTNAEEGWDLENIHQLLLEAVLWIRDFVARSDPDPK